MASESGLPLAGRCRDGDDALTWLVNAMARVDVQCWAIATMSGVRRLSAADFPPL